MNLYKLDTNKRAVPCSMEEWSVITSEEKIVKKSWFGGIQVSTVFLGIDGSVRRLSPILFETMIFGGDEDGFQMRYGTWEESVKGHEEACLIADKVSIEREKKLKELGI
jgi:hypothetical protein